MNKHISPDFHNEAEDKFEITIDAPFELEKDKELIKKGGVASRDIVNGVIVNDVFEKLNIKTTNLTLDISEDGKEIKTTLADRGQVIFEIVERNVKYLLLHNIHISLFYLNRIAKINFTRLMGIEPVNYGSVFVYKNGFRVNPYGDPNEDFFGIDRRKSQGYNRFLGTREIMGRISISGDNDGFIETSSRAHGFIQTDEVDSLSDLFVQKVLKVLERYVVNVIDWNNPNETEKEISPSDVSDKILAEFADLSAKNDIISLKYDEALFARNIKANEDSLTNLLKKLKRTADKTQNESLYKLINTVKKQTDIIKKQNIELEEENRKKAADLKKEKDAGAIKDKQIFFLKGAANNNVSNLINGMHAVFTQSEAIKGNIDLLEDTIHYFVCANNKVDYRGECPGRHYVRADAIEQVVMLELHRMAEFLESDEEAFAELLAQKADKELLREKKHDEEELQKAIVRNDTVSNLYEKLYEDNATGKVSDEWFMQLSHKYEVERLELKSKIKTLRQKLSKCGQCERNRDTFTSAIRRFMRMDRLTAPLLRELIDHIDVFETEGTGKSRTQRIVIYYRFVGYVEIPEVSRRQHLKADTRKGVAVEYLTEPLPA